MQSVTVMTNKNKVHDRIHIPNTHLDVKLLECSLQSHSVAREVGGHCVVQQHQLLVHYFNLKRLKRN